MRNILYSLTLAFALPVLAMDEAKDVLVELYHYSRAEVKQAEDDLSCNQSVAITEDMRQQVKKVCAFIMPRENINSFKEDFHFLARFKYAESCDLPLEKIECVQKLPDVENIKRTCKMLCDKRKKETCDCDKYFIELNKAVGISSALKENTSVSECSSSHSSFGPKQSEMCLVKDHLEKAFSYLNQKNYQMCPIEDMDGAPNAQCSAVFSGGEKNPIPSPTPSYPSSSPSPTPTYEQK